MYINYKEHFCSSSKDVSNFRELEVHPKTSDYYLNCFYEYNLTYFCCNILEESAWVVIF